MWTLIETLSGSLSESHIVIPNQTNFTLTLCSIQTTEEFPRVLTTNIKESVSCPVCLKRARLLQIPTAY